MIIRGTPPANVCLMVLPHYLQRSVATPSNPINPITRHPMKFLLLIALAVPVLAFVSCESTTIVAPEPTAVSETQTRRTSTTSSSYGGMPDSVSTTETRSVISQ